jgi:hypothetical protein
MNKLPITMRPPNTNLGVDKPPTPIQLELQELRTKSNELGFAVQDLWERLATVVSSPREEEQTPTQSSEIIPVPLARDLHEILNNIEAAINSLRILTSSIAL